MSTSTQNPYDSEFLGVAKSASPWWVHSVQGRCVTQQKVRPTLVLQEIRQQELAGYLLAYVSPQMVPMKPLVPPQTARLQDVLGV